MKRKLDHIQLAEQSQFKIFEQNKDFYYEPLFSADTSSMDLSLTFLGKRMMNPIWISSMTGGLGEALIINKNLARLTNEFKLGMGLGSCRSFFFKGERKEDFALRELVGEQPFYANLGIAQIEEIIINKNINKLKNHILELQCDGLIIHINPIQEFLQPEGDRIKLSPLETLKIFLENTDIPVIIKEVGQGFGPKSLEELMSLPIAAIELAGLGGTNFASVELARQSLSEASKRENLQSLAGVGHTPMEMIQWINDLTAKKPYSCQSFIISGGVDGFLTGYKYLSSLQVKDKVYGQGYQLLKRANGDYAILRDYFMSEIEGLKFAHGYLKRRN
jgi:isopentenyl-diphosphate delta-isomerase